MSIVLTPLRQFAIDFAMQAGYINAHIKIKECAKAGVFAYDVYVRVPGATRGKHIGSVIDSTALADAQQEFFSKPRRPPNYPGTCGGYGVIV